jgi:peptide subunit release factor 1 (eRF1)
MHERAAQRSLVAAILEGVGSGRAENGTRAVLRALSKHQVRNLLVRADLDAGGGFRCDQSGRLVVSAADCRGEGDPMPVPDLFQAACEEARRQGATVTSLDDPDVARPIEGLAALLRWQ